MKHLRLSTKLILFAILLLGAAFRYYNLQWDQGFHLHPDERAIVMKVVELKFPAGVDQFLSPESPWNPNFFAYGSLPFYLLKIGGMMMSGVDREFANYGLINIIGRFMSAFTDLLSIFVLFKIGKKLFSTKIGLVAAFFYAISVLPIQLSHFYAVDTILTFFILVTLYQLILFYEKPTVLRALLIGFFFGTALATKISAIVLLVAIGTVLAVDFSLVFLKSPHKPRHWLPHLPHFLQHLLLYLLLIVTTAGVTFALFEPYAIIDFPEFWANTMEQSAMTHNAFIFPYTLQYVGKIPYLYEFKNIFFYGMGPILATLAFLGALYFFYLACFKEKEGKWATELILVVFFIAYVGVVGRFSVGFMRYMLPVYPLLALFAAVMVKRLASFFPLSPRVKMIVGCYCAALIIIWPVCFMHIYTQFNPRVSASTWINQFIPAGKTLAIEHWDDSLPLYGQTKYIQESLALYDPDTKQKWNTISNQLNQTDYIIIASNRLYTPLMKMTDCKNLPQGKCYTKTAEYYSNLFSGKLGFQKVAEFTNYPTFPFFDIALNDQDADESFTVYDHPKIMIFKKIAANN